MQRQHCGVRGHRGGHHDLPPHPHHHPHHWLLRCLVSSTIFQSQHYMFFLSQSSLLATFLSVLSTFHTSCTFQIETLQLATGSKVGFKSRNLCMQQRWRRYFKLNITRKLKLARMSQKLKDNSSIYTGPYQ